MVCELPEQCIHVGDRLGLRGGLKLQHWTDLPTAAVAIRVFLELSEKVCAVSGSIGLLATTACETETKDISVDVNTVRQPMQLTVGLKWQVDFAQAITALKGIGATMRTRSLLEQECIRKSGFRCRALESGPSCANTPRAILEW